VTSDGDPFDRRYPRRNGVVRTLERSPRLGPAQRSNLLATTAMLYEPLWRRRSLALLSGGAIGTPRELAELRRWAGTLGEGRLLDVGSSSGLYARTIAAAAPQLEVHALDVSLAFLRELRRRAQRQGVEVVPVHGDAEGLPYRDGAFAAVAVGGTLNELRDPRRALVDQARVLHRGGALWQMFLVAAERPRGRRLQRLLSTGGIAFPTEETVLGWADEAGLELRSIERWPPVVIARFERRRGPVGGSPAR
jgi:2-polyprenyl-6-hydroxyphenyl methylase/3-demethylubiquinone-9 3-methyltransferase